MILISQKLKNKEIFIQKLGINVTLKSDSQSPFNSSA